MQDENYLITYDVAFTCKKFCIHSMSPLPVNKFSLECI